MEIKHDLYCYIAKWKGNLRLKFGLPILHPRIEFIHLDIAVCITADILLWACPIKCQSMEKLGISSFLCGITLPSSYSQTKISKPYFCGEI